MKTPGALALCNKLQLFRAGKEIPIDELVSILNPVKAMDLRQILTLVPAYDRPRMALAFANLTYEAWGVLAGVGYNGTNRWILKREFRIPFGAAIRLAKVLGQPVDELFADWI